MQRVWEASAFPALNLPKPRAPRRSASTCLELVPGFRVDNRDVSNLFLFLLKAQVYSSFIKDARTGGKVFPASHTAEFIRNKCKSTNQCFMEAFLLTQRHA